MYVYSTGIFSCVLVRDILRYIQDHRDGVELMYKYYTVPVPLCYTQVTTQDHLQIRLFSVNPPHQYIFWKTNKNPLLKRLVYQPESFNLKFIL